MLEHTEKVCCATTTTTTTTTNNNNNNNNNNNKSIYGSPNLTAKEPIVKPAQNHKHKISANAKKKH